MLNRFKDYLENIKITPISWLAGMSGILMVRFFLESLSSRTSSGFFASDASTLVHYYLFFLAIAVIFMILVQIFLPGWKKISPQFVAISLLAVFIAPIVDWIINGRSAVTMTYLFYSPKEMLISLFSFFGNNLSHGVTLGIRIEVVLILLFFGLLVYLVEKNVFRSIVSVISLYVLIFIFLSLPGIMNMMGGYGATQNYFNQPLSFIQESIEKSATLSNNVHNSLQYSSTVRLFEISFNFLMGKVLFLILVASASLWFYLNFKERFKAVILNSRPERIVHYLVMIFLGFSMAYSFFSTVKFNWNDYFSMIILCLSFYFSWMFAVCSNDIVDEDIDAISNANRPLVLNSLSKEDMKQASVIFLVASLISAYLAGYTAFFFILTFTALYYIYSVPPTRLKLIPFFSSFLIGLCCLAAVMAGFFLISPLKYVSTFPSRIIFAVVAIFFFGSHIRDIKDIEGDKKAGIKTVPILFGEVWGPRVVGIFAGLAFLLVPILLKIYILFLTAIPASAAVYYFVNRKPYSEKFVFTTYFVFALLSFFLLTLF